MQLALSTGRPIAQIARDLGVHKEALRLWVHRARADAGTSELSGSERAELDRLRAENTELRRANELLKTEMRILTTEFGRPGSRRLPQLMISVPKSSSRRDRSKMWISPQQDAVAVLGAAETGDGTRPKDGASAADDGARTAGGDVLPADGGARTEKTGRHVRASDPKCPGQPRREGRISTMETAADHRRPGPGLRERKKAKTRETICRHAMRLFREQGYSATTVDQIAEAAEISQTTFFRYFPTKEDVVLQDDYDPVFVEALRSQPPELNPVGALRAALRTVAAGMSGTQADGERERHELIVSVPELRARMLEEFIATVRRIGDVMAERLGRPADDFAVRNLAGAITGVVMSVYLDVAATPSASGPFGSLDEALAHLEAGLPL